MRKKMLMSLMSLSLLVLLGGPSAYAQITGTVVAKIPFSFYAGNTKLPAGKYLITPLDDSNLSEMEITSANGHTSALFGVRDSEVNARPSKSELIFDKYGNRYFLAKIYEDGDRYGSALIKSRYELREVKRGTTAETRSVPCQRRSG